MASAEHASTARVGVLYGVAAYGLWGLFPVYFKAVKTVPTLEVLAHRIIWSFLLLALLVLIWRGRTGVRAAFASRRNLITLSVTTLLIANNWGVFIWAVASDYLLQASLGYFINPLVYVLLGFVFLRERLRRWQTFSVILAGVGCAYLTFVGGQFPWIALLLAFSFGFYGLLRKTAQVDALIGLTVETALLTPIALLFLIHQMAVGSAVFGSGSWRMSLLLVLAGVVTATPLLWFTEAARRLRLATIGFLQFLAPTGHFLLAVFAYGEPFRPEHIVTFACIWTALAVYSVESALYVRSAARRPATPPIIE